MRTIRIFLVSSSELKHSAEAHARKPGKETVTPEVLTAIA